MELALGLQMHQAPRRVSTGAAVSERLWRRRSLIAGCWQSVDLSRLALWDVLEYAHGQCRPQELGTWLDDIIHQEVGREAGVADKMS